MAWIDKGETSRDLSQHSSALRVSVADMRTFLERIKPATSSAALSTLRKAFPHVPLKDRVTACEAYSRTFRREIRDGRNGHFPPNH